MPDTASSFNMPYTTMNNYNWLFDLGIDPDTNMMKHQPLAQHVTIPIMENVPQNVVAHRAPAVLFVGVYCFDADDGDGPGDDRYDDDADRNRQMPISNGREHLPTDDGIDHAIAKHYHQVQQSADPTWLPAHGVSGNDHAATARLRSECCDVASTC